MDAVPLNCQHHVQWVRPVEGGLHQCILCHRVVGRAEVYPKLDDLPEEFRRRWDAHEAKRSAPVAEPATKPPSAPPKPPSAPAKPTAAPEKPPAAPAKASASPAPSQGRGTSATAAAADQATDGASP